MWRDWDTGWRGILVVVRYAIEGSLLLVASQSRAHLGVELVHEACNAACTHRLFRSSCSLHALMCSAPSRATHAGCPNFLIFACMLHGIAKKVESQLAALPLS